jgi:hypothetical protein
MELRDRCVATGLQLRSSRLGALPTPRPRAAHRFGAAPPLSIPSPPTLHPHQQVTSTHSAVANRDGGLLPQRQRDAAKVVAQPPDATALASAQRKLFCRITLLFTLVVMINFLDKGNLAFAALQAGVWGTAATRVGEGAAAPPAHLLSTVWLLALWEQSPGPDS